MDVRCEHCRAHYVLEDERITEAGLVVRCSTCGYTFRVKRKALFVTVPVGADESNSGPVLNPPRPPAFTPAPEKREWRVRQAGSDVFFTCKELTTLQKWIVERKVGRNDEISLSGPGANWKRLGDIPELASFFQVVDAAERPPTNETETLPPVSAPVAPKPPPAPPAARKAAPAPRPQQSSSISSVFDQGPVDDSEQPAPANSNTAKSPDKTWEIPAEVAAPLRTPEAEPAWVSAGKISTPIRQKPHRIKPPAVKSGSGPTMALAVALLVVAGAAAAVYILKPEWLGLQKAPEPQNVEPQVLPPPAPPAPSPGVVQPTAPSTARPPEVKPPPSPAAPSPTPTPPPATAAASPSEAAPTAAPAAVPPPTSPAPVEAKPTPAAPESPPAEAQPSPPPGAPSPVEPKPPAAAVAPGAPEAPGAPAAPTEGSAPSTAAPPSTAAASTAKTAVKTEPAKPESPAKRLRTLLIQAKRQRDRGKSQEALTLYAQASELSPNSPDIAAGQGWCYLDLSQYALAVKSFEAALQRAPTHADALMGLAETYRYEGRNADAVKYYEKYLEAHPDGEDATAAKNAVSQLKE